MALKDFKQIQNIDKDLEKVQSNVREYVRQLNQFLLDGNILTSINLTTATRNVSHGLGRNYQGFIILDRQSSATVWRDGSISTNKDKFIPLRASANITISLWVF